ncbi:MAG: methylglyoxal synthase [Dehalococcoidia bacterium]
MRKTLALVAHDSKKDALVQLVKAHKGELTEVDLIATRDTGQLTQERTGLPVRLLQSGPLGGDQQIGALIASGGVNAVIFLRDPLTAHPQEPDVSALLRICDVHNVPLATNLATAEAVLHLVAEHPQALGKHQLAAHIINEMAFVS